MSETDTHRTLESGDAKENPKHEGWAQDAFAHMRMWLSGCLSWGGGFTTLCYGMSLNMLSAVLTQLSNCDLKPPATT